LTAPFAIAANAAHLVARRLPDDGDTKLRAICTVCHTVHYENPLNVVGTVPALGRPGACCASATSSRAKANGHCLQASWSWANPHHKGAARETTEEAGAQFIMEDLLTVMSVPRVGQVHLYYRARLTSDVFDPGHETMEARLFKRSKTFLGTSWRFAPSRKRLVALLCGPPCRKLQHPRLRHCLNNSLPPRKGGIGLR
jgi:hypothetical protein